MTKVLVRSRRTVWLACCFLLTSARAQAAEPSPQCPQTTGALYARIHSVGLDPDRVYHVRGATIDRPNLHIDFDDGTLAFTSDICGRTTGAFFDGEGEVRLRPPNRAERGSLALFTGMAILEEQFTTAYLRFNDDTATLLQPFLTPAPEPADFIKEWGDTSLTLAEFDGLRLLLDFSHFLPSSSSNATDQKFVPLLHAHLLGKRLGGFEIVWDAANQEPLWAGQPRMKDDNLFFDIWTSFAPAGTVAPPIADASITNFRIHASVEPPTRLQALADLNLQVRSGGERTLLFELSRYLKVEAIESDDHPVDFIQNPAIEGSELRRKGNDLVAVVFPAPLAPSQQLNLRFRYAGDVLSEAGTGLLYVGERGTWYPNFGLSPAHFDLEFRYPPDWTLVATGKQVSRASAENSETNPTATTEKVSRWISERPIPVAGFNLGKYVRAEAKAGHVVVEAYGTKGVEKSFPKAHEEVVAPILPTAPRQGLQPMEPLVVTPPPPSPARDAQAVADRAARSITSFSQWFGPYPYNSLALTQMPGLMSQGWPGLVFLSSFAFLSRREQADLHLGPVASAIDNQVLVHETAHQWWGDLVLWNSYRDQWLAEGLANYASLLMLEQRNPAQFQQILEKYRHDLLSKNNDGEWLRDAGPVTFGAASRFLPFSQRIRRNQLRARHLALSHAPHHAARFGGGLSFPKRTAEFAL